MLVPTLLPDLDETAQEKLDAVHGAIFGEKYLGTAKLFPAARDLLARGGAARVLASSASAEELEHYPDLPDAHDLVEAPTSTESPLAQVQ